MQKDNNIGSTQSSSLNSANNASLVQHHHSPIASKQIPFNNRCRSPSPGLFQDIDLYNFSSDTLFSTYLVEDTKDPVFGTNPDFFQPDLMHLYPNFDFFELCDNDFMSTTTANSLTGSTKNDAKLTSSDIQTTQQSQSPSQSSYETTSQTISSSTVTVSQQTPHNFSRSQSSNYEQQAHLQNMGSISVSVSSTPSVLMVHQSSGQSLEKYGSVGYSTVGDLSNFDTLVNVATAQSPATAQKQSQAVLNVDTNPVIHYSNRYII